MSWLEWDDNKLLALCVWREASGEGYAGMAAVACVILNRVKAWKKTLRQVILGKNQFSSMSVPTDPVYEKLPIQADSSWRIARGIADDALNGLMPDATDGALFYANLNTATSGWFQKNIVENTTEHPQTCKLGKHTFFA